VLGGESVPVEARGARYRARLDDMTDPVHRPGTDAWSGASARQWRR
jgi:hypothetical protein